MKIVTPPQWFTNLKDWLYGASVIVGVPSVIVSFTAAHVEAKQLSLQYLEDNFLLIIYIAGLAAVMILSVITIFSGLSWIIKKIKKL